MVILLLADLPSAVTYLQQSFWGSIRCWGLPCAGQEYCRQCKNLLHMFLFSLAPLRWGAVATAMAFHQVDIPRRSQVSLCQSIPRCMFHHWVGVKQENQPHTNLFHLLRMDPFTRGIAFWRGGCSALGTWMTGVFNIAAVRSWPCVFPVITEKTVNIKAHACTKLAVCLVCSNVCVSAGCKYAEGNTSCCLPDRSMLSIRVKPPHICGLCLYMKGRNSLGFWHCLGKKFQKSSTWCFWACISGFLNVPQSRHGSDVYFKTQYAMKNNFWTTCALIS